ncbi:erythropoietin receptor [Guaruba guarouba]
MSCCCGARGCPPARWRCPRGVGSSAWGRCGGHHGDGARADPSGRAQLRRLLEPLVPARDRRDPPRRGPGDPGAAILVLALGLLGLLGHRRALQEKLWPPVPGPEREFEGLFSAYGGNFQLWLCHGVGAPWTPPGGAPEAEELPSTVEEVGPPPGKGPPPPAGDPPRTPPRAGPSPSSSFEYTLFDPGSALLTPRGAPSGPGDPPSPPPTPPHGSYANLAP